MAHLARRQWASCSGRIGIVSVAWGSSKPALVIHGEASSGRSATLRSVAVGCVSCLGGVGGVGGRSETCSGVISLLREIALRRWRGETVAVIATASAFGTKSTSKSLESGSHVDLVEEVMNGGRSWRSTTKEGCIDRIEFWEESVQ